MENNTPNPNEFKAINILHKAMLFGQIFFAGIAAFLVYCKSFSSPLQEQSSVFIALDLILSAAAILVGTTLFNKKLEEIRESGGDWNVRFNDYRAASIRRWAMMEGACLLSIICFLITASYPLLALAIAIIIIFLVTGPSKAKIEQQLELDDEEEQQLQG